MNEEAVRVLARITQKTLPELTEYDKAFLYARRSYLSAQQLEKFESVFPKRKEKKVAKEAAGEQLTYKQLQSKAASLGMPSIVGISRETLEAYIKNNSKE